MLVASAFPHKQEKLCINPLIQQTGGGQQVVFFSLASELVEVCQEPRITIWVSTKQDPQCRYNMCVSYHQSQKCKQQFSAHLQRADLPVNFESEPTTYLQNYVCCCLKSKDLITNTQNIF